MVLPSIESLQWDDEEEVVAYFRAMLARLGYPLPRAAVLDGLEVPIFSGQDSPKVQRLDVRLIHELAGDLTPASYHNLLFTQNPVPQGTEHLYPFLKTFGIWPCAAAWFKYHLQLALIREYVASVASKKVIEVLVHATWNGEDAFSIAVMLHYCFPKHSFRVIGKDFILPRIEDLQWIDTEHIPIWLSGCTSTFFTEITQEVIALKLELACLVELSQGDLRDPCSYGTNKDMIIMNGVLGQTLTRSNEIRTSIEHATKALCKGGRLFIDNSSFTITHPEYGLTLENMIYSEFVANNRMKLIVGKSNSGQFVLESPDNI